MRGSFGEGPCGLRISLLCLLLALIPSGARARNWVRDLSGAPSFHSASNLSFRVVGKQLDDDWSPADRQLGVGVDFDHTREEWPVSAFGSLLWLHGSGDAGSLHVTSSVCELNLGARKIWYDFRDLWPYAGAGLAGSYFSAERAVAGRTQSDDELALGVWAGAGLYYRIAERLVLGIDLRWSFLNATLFGRDVDGGGWYAGTAIGYQWREGRPY